MRNNIQLRQGIELEKLTLQEFLVSERETSDSVSGAWHHVLEEELATLVGVEVDGVVGVHLVPEVPVHRLQEPTLAGELDGTAVLTLEAALEDGLRELLLL